MKFFDLKQGQDLENRVAHLHQEFPEPDHLPPLVLKECAIEIAPNFCSLLNRSFLLAKYQTPGRQLTMFRSQSEHVNVTVNKANKLLGLFHRTVGSSNPGAFSTLYKSLVHPFLEYAAPAWNSYLCQRQKKLSEEPFSLQKRGEIRHEDRLRKLKWSTLEKCRFFLRFS